MTPCDCNQRALLGARWFAERVHRPADAPSATINGEPAEVEAAVARAAELLRHARRPMLYGFEAPRWRTPGPPWHWPTGSGLSS